MVFLCGKGASQHNKDTQVKNNLTEILAQPKWSQLGIRWRNLLQSFQGQTTAAPSPAKSRAGNKLWSSLY